MNPILTTDRAVTNPADRRERQRLAWAPASWKYVRQVSVSLLPGTTDPNVRLVNVRVYLNRDDNGDGRPDTLAEVAGVIRTAAGNFPPTQVYDVYAIAIENVPGWWVYMANLIPFVQNAVQNVQSRNPGLEFRVHWITKLAYGRDMQYRPQINSRRGFPPADRQRVLLPGQDALGRSGRLLLPAGQLQGSHPGRQHRHERLRRRDESRPVRARRQLQPRDALPGRAGAVQPARGRAAWRATTRRRCGSSWSGSTRIRTGTGTRSSSTSTASCSRFPPVRNYSDAAKDPGELPEHPGRDAPGATPLRGRLDERQAPGLLVPDGPRQRDRGDDRDWLGQSVPGGVPITVILKGVSWTPTSGRRHRRRSTGEPIRTRTRGRRHVRGRERHERRSSPNGMYYTSTTSGGDTIIKLYNSPLKSPEVAVSGSGPSPSTPGSTRASGSTASSTSPPRRRTSPSGHPDAAFASNLATATH